MVALRFQESTNSGCPRPRTDLPLVFIGQSKSQGESKTRVREVNSTSWWDKSDKDFEAIFNLPQYLCLKVWIYVPKNKTKQTENHFLYQVVCKDHMLFSVSSIKWSFHHAEGRGIWWSGSLLACIVKMGMFIFLILSFLMILLFSIFC